MIFNIQRFSTHDGGGIRTMVFFKGCPLRCAWCSNPESQSFEPQIMFEENRCRNFGDCLLAYPSAIKKTGSGIVINRSLLKDPEKLRNICPSKALTVVGEKKSLKELVAEIEKDMPFYNNSNGGVTLSGGEPLSQGSGLVLLLNELKKRNIDTAVETSLHVRWGKIERTSGLVSTYLADIKHTNSRLFRKYTGGDIDLVFGNLARLSAGNENIIIRIPVIPGFNHTETEMKNIIDYVFSLRNITEIHFIPYHTLGIEKYRMLGMEYTYGHYKSVHAGELEGYVKYSQSLGFITQTGG